MMSLVDQINQSNLGPVSFLAQGIKKEWSNEKENYNLLDTQPTYGIFWR